MAVPLEFDMRHVIIAGERNWPISARLGGHKPVFQIRPNRVGMPSSLPADVDSLWTKTPWWPIFTPGPFLPPNRRKTCGNFLRIGRFTFYFPKTGNFAAWSKSALLNESVSTNSSARCCKKQGSNTPKALPAYCKFEGSPHSWLPDIEKSSLIC